MTRYKFAFSQARCLLSLLVASMLAVGCADAPTRDAAAGETDATSEAITATAPSPFAMQFAGVYEDARAAQGALRAFEIHRDGRYVAHFKGVTKSKKGSLHASHPNALPLVFSFRVQGKNASASIEAYDSTIAVHGLGTDTVLRATSAVGPNEELCDSTGGAWADDDPDPVTGLYCVCPPGNVYVPNDGGCVP